MKCSNCGLEVSKDTKICPVCKSEIKEKKSNDFLIGVASAAAGIASVEGLKRVHKSKKESKKELKDQLTKSEEIPSNDTNNVNDTNNINDNQVSKNIDKNNDSLVIDYKNLLNGKDVVKNIISIANNDSINEDLKEYFEEIIKNNDENNSLEDYLNTLDEEEINEIIDKIKEEINENIDIEDIETDEELACICTTKCSESSINLLCPVCSKKYESCEAITLEKNESTNVNETWSKDRIIAYESAFVYLCELFGVGSTSDISYSKLQCNQTIGGMRYKCNTGFISSFKPKEYDFSNITKIMQNIKSSESTYKQSLIDTQKIFDYMEMEKRVKQQYDLAEVSIDLAKLANETREVTQYTDYENNSTYIIYNNNKLYLDKNTNEYVGTDNDGNKISLTTRDIYEGYGYDYSNFLNECGNYSNATLSDDKKYYTINGKKYTIDDFKKMTELSAVNLVLLLSAGILTDDDKLGDGDGTIEEYLHEVGDRYRYLDSEKEKNVTYNRTDLEKDLEELEWEYQVNREDKNFGRSDDELFNTYKDYMYTYITSENQNNQDIETQKLNLLKIAAEVNVDKYFLQADDEESMAVVMNHDELILDEFIANAYYILNNYNDEDYEENISNLDYNIYKKYISAARVLIDQIHIGGQSEAYGKNALTESIELKNNICKMYDGSNLDYESAFQEYTSTGENNLYESIYGEFTSDDLNRLYENNIIPSSELSEYTEIYYQKITTPLKEKYENDCHKNGITVYDEDVQRYIESNIYNFYEINNDIFDNQFINNYYLYQIAEPNYIVNYRKLKNIVSASEKITTKEYNSLYNQNAWKCLEIDENYEDVFENTCNSYDEYNAALIRNYAFALLIGQYGETNLFNGKLYSKDENGEIIGNAFYELYDRIATANAHNTKDLIYEQDKYGYIDNYNFLNFSSTYSEIINEIEKYNSNQDNNIYLSLKQSIGDLQDIFNNLKYSYKNNVTEIQNQYVECLAAIYAGNVSNIKSEDLTNKQSDFINKLLENIKNKTIDEYTYSEQLLYIADCYKNNIDLTSNLKDELEVILKEYCTVNYDGNNYYESGIYNCYISYKDENGNVQKTDLSDVILEWIDLYYSPQNNDSNLKLFYEKYGLNELDFDSQGFNFNTALTAFFQKSDCDVNDSNGTIVSILAGSLANNINDMAVKVAEKVCDIQGTNLEILNYESTICQYYLDDFSKYKVNEIYKKCNENKDLYNSFQFSSLSNLMNVLESDTTYCKKIANGNFNLSNIIGLDYVDENGEIIEKNQEIIEESLIYLESYANDFKEKLEDIYNNSSLSYEEKQDQIKKVSDNLINEYFNDKDNYFGKLRTNSNLKLSESNEFTLEQTINDAKKVNDCVNSIENSVKEIASSISSDFFNTYDSTISFLDGIIEEKNHVDNYKNLMNRINQNYSKIYSIQSLITKNDYLSTIDLEESKKYVQGIYQSYTLKNNKVYDNSSGDVVDSNDALLYLIYKFLYDGMTDEQFEKSLKKLGENVLCSNIYEYIYALKCEANDVREYTDIFEESNTADNLFKLLVNTAKTSGFLTNGYNSIIESLYNNSVNYVGDKDNDKRLSKITQNDNIKIGAITYYVDSNGYLTNNNDSYAKADVMVATEDANGKVTYKKETIDVNVLDIYFVEDEETGLKYACVKDDKGNDQRVYIVQNENNINIVKNANNKKTDGYAEYHQGTWSDYWKNKGYAISDGWYQFTSGYRNAIKADGLLNSHDVLASSYASYLKQYYGRYMYASYNVVTSVTNMAPSIVAGLAIGTVCKSAGISTIATAILNVASTAATMGVTSYGNYKEENLQSGMTVSGSKRSALISAAGEVGLESFLGTIPGISLVSKGAENAVYSGLVSSIQNLYSGIFAEGGKAALKAAGTDALSFLKSAALTFCKEGIEEAAQDYLNDIAQKANGGEGVEDLFKTSLQSFWYGGVTGILLGFGGIISQNVSQAITGDGMAINNALNFVTDFAVSNNNVLDLTELAFNSTAREQFYTLMNEFKNGNYKTLIESYQSNPTLIENYNRFVEESNNKSSNKVVNGITKLITGNETITFEDYCSQELMKNILLKSEIKNESLKFESENISQFESERLSEISNRILEDITFNDESIKTEIAERVKGCTSIDEVIKAIFFSDKGGHNLREGINIKNNDSVNLIIQNAIKDTNGTFSHKTSIDKIVRLIKENYESDITKISNKLSNEYFNTDYSIVENIDKVKETFELINNMDASELISFDIFNNITNDNIQMFIKAISQSLMNTNVVFEGLLKTIDSNNNTELFELFYSKINNENKLQYTKELVQSIQNIDNAELRNIYSKDIVKYINISETTINEYMDELKGLKDERNTSLIDSLMNELNLTESEIVEIKELLKYSNNIDEIIESIFIENNSKVRNSFIDLINKNNTLSKVEKNNLVNLLQGKITETNKSQIIEAIKNYYKNTINEINTKYENKVKTHINDSALGLYLKDYFIEILNENVDLNNLIEETNELNSRKENYINKLKSNKSILDNLEQNTSEYEDLVSENNSILIELDIIERKLNSKIKTLKEESIKLYSKMLTTSVTETIPGQTETVLYNSKNKLDSIDTILEGTKSSEETRISILLGITSITGNMLTNNNSSLVSDIINFYRGRINELKLQNKIHKKNSNIVSRNNREIQKLQNSEKEILDIMIEYDINKNSPLKDLNTKLNEEKQFLEKSKDSFMKKSDEEIKSLKTRIDNRIKELQELKFNNNYEEVLNKIKSQIGNIELETNIENRKTLLSNYEIMFESVDKSINEQISIYKSKVNDLIEQRRSDLEAKLKDINDMIKDLEEQSDKIRKSLRKKPNGYKLNELENIKIKKTEKKLDDNKRLLTSRYRIKERIQEKIASLDNKAHNIDNGNFDIEVKTKDISNLDLKNTIETKKTLLESIKNLTSRIDDTINYSSIVDRVKKLSLKDELSKLRVKLDNRILSENVITKIREKLDGIKDNLNNIIKNEASEVVNETINNEDVVVIAEETNNENTVNETSNVVIEPTIGTYNLEGKTIEELETLRDKIDNISDSLSDEYLKLKEEFDTIDENSNPDEKNKLKNKMFECLGRNDQLGKILVSISDKIYEINNSLKSELNSIQEEVIEIADEINNNNNIIDDFLKINGNKTVLEQKLEENSNIDEETMNILKSNPNTLYYLIKNNSSIKYDYNLLFKKCNDGRLLLNKIYSFRNINDPNIVKSFIYNNGDLYLLNDIVIKKYLSSLEANEILDLLKSKYFKQIILDINYDTLIDNLSNEGTVELLNIFKDNNYYNVTGFTSNNKFFDMIINKKEYDFLKYASQDMLFNEINNKKIIDYIIENDIEYVYNPIDNFNEQLISYLIDNKANSLLEYITSNLKFNEFEEILNNNDETSYNKILEINDNVFNVYMYLMSSKNEIYELAGYIERTDNKKITPIIDKIKSTKYFSNLKEDVLNGKKKLTLKIKDTNKNELNLLETYILSYILPNEKIMQIIDYDFVKQCYEFDSFYTIKICKNFSFNYIRFEYNNMKFTIQNSYFEFLMLKDKADLSELCKYADENGFIGKLILIDDKVVSSNQIGKYIDFTNFENNIFLECVSNNTSYGVNQRINLNPLIANDRSIINFLSNKYHMEPSFVKNVSNIIMDHKSGACSYANICNAIFYAFRNDSTAFKNHFGFDMYIEENGKIIINRKMLILDMYLFMNSKQNGGLMFELDSNNKLIIAHDSEFQVFMANYENIEKYLNYYNVNITMKSPDIFNSNVLDSDGKVNGKKLSQLLKNELAAGRTISIYEVVIKSNDKFQNKEISFYKNESCDKIDRTTYQWVKNEDKNGSDAHITYITEVTDNGVYVVSWGEKLFIKYDNLDLIDKVDSDYNSSLYIYDISYNPSNVTTEADIQVKNNMNNKIKDKMGIDDTTLNQFNNLTNNITNTNYKNQSISQNENNSNVQNKNTLTDNILEITSDYRLEENSPLKALMESLNKNKQNDVIKIEENINNTSNEKINIIQENNEFKNFTEKYIIDSNELCSEILKVCENQNLDVKNIKFLSSGESSIAFEIDDKVMKINFMSYDNPEFKTLTEYISHSKEILPIDYEYVTNMNVYGSPVRIIINEKLSTTNISKEDLFNTYIQLRNDGYLWSDIKSENLGKDENGNCYLIDYGELIYINNLAEYKQNQELKSHENGRASEYAKRYNILNENIEILKTKHSIEACQYIIDQLDFINGFKLILENATAESIIDIIDDIGYNSDQFEIFDKIDKNRLFELITKEEIKSNISKLLFEDLIYAFLGKMSTLEEKKKILDTAKGYVKVDDIIRNIFTSITNIEEKSEFALKHLVYLTYDLDLATELLKCCIYESKLSILSKIGVFSMSKSMVNDNTIYSEMVKYLISEMTNFNDKVKFFKQEQSHLDKKTMNEIQIDLTDELCNLQSSEINKNLFIKIKTNYLSSLNIYKECEIAGKNILQVFFNDDIYYIEGIPEDVFSKFHNKKEFENFCNTYKNDNKYILSITEENGNLKVTKGLNISNYFEYKSIENDIFMMITENNGNYGVNQRPVISKLFKNSGMIELLSDRYNMSIYKIERVINEVIDKEGACSYADKCNAILSAFRNDSTAFKEHFGFNMYLCNIDSILSINYELNAITLLTDMYLFMNSKENGGKIFDLVNGQLDIVGTSKDQVYMSDNNAIQKYFDHYNVNVTVNDFDYSTALDSNGKINGKKLAQLLRNELAAGRMISIGEYVTKSDYKITRKNIPFYNDDGTKYRETYQWVDSNAKNGGAGHITYITGVTDNGVYVVSWGKKLFIKYDNLDLINKVDSYYNSSLYVYDISYNSSNETANVDRYVRDDMNNKIKEIMGIDDTTLNQFKNLTSNFTNTNKNQSISQNENNSNVQNKNTLKDNILEETSKYGLEENSPLEALRESLVENNQNELTRNQKDVIDIRDNQDIIEINEPITDTLIDKYNDLKAKIDKYEGNELINKIVYITENEFSEILNDDRLFDKGAYLLLNKKCIYIKKENFYNLLKNNSKLYNYMLNNIDSINFKTYMKYTDTLNLFKPIALKNIDVFASILPEVIKENNNLLSDSIWKEVFLNANYMEFFNTLSSIDDLDVDFINKKISLLSDKESINLLIYYYDITNNTPSYLHDLYLKYKSELDNIKISEFLSNINESSSIEDINKAKEIINSEIGKNILFRFKLDKFNDIIKSLGLNDSFNSYREEYLLDILNNYNNYSLETNKNVLSLYLYDNTYDNLILDLETILEYAKDNQNAKELLLNEEKYYTNLYNYLIGNDNINPLEFLSNNFSESLENTLTKMFELFRSEVNKAINPEIILKNSTIEYIDGVKIYKIDNNNKCIFLSHYGSLNGFNYDNYVENSKLYNTICMSLFDSNHVDSADIYFGYNNIDNELYSVTTFDGQTNQKRKFALKQYKSTLLSIDSFMKNTSKTHNELTYISNNETILPSYILCINRNQNENEIRIAKEFDIPIYIYYTSDMNNNKNIKIDKKHYNYEKDYINIISNN